MRQAARRKFMNVELFGGKNKKTLFFNIIFLLMPIMPILLICGCVTPVTIPEGKEYITLRNAKITPDVITEKGSLITVEYDSTTFFKDMNNIFVGYLIATEGLIKKPAILTGDVVYLLRLSDLNVENRKIIIPITSIVEPESSDWLKKNKIYRIYSRVKVDPDSWKYFKKDKKYYVGSSTISLYLASEKGERLSNILRILVTFEQF